MTPRPQYPILWIAVSLSLVLWGVGGVYVAASNYQRRVTNTQRLCVLHKTLVTYMTTSYATVTKQQAMQNPTRYNQGYILGTTLVRDLVREAPCEFSYTIPPNVLESP